MRSFITSALLGLGALGITAAVPAQAQASWLSEALHRRYDPNYGSYYAAPAYPYDSGPVYVYPPAYYPPDGTYYYGPSYYGGSYYRGGDYGRHERHEGHEHEGRHHR
jgi:hypothetical protein